MPEMKIEYLSIDALKPYERNAKKHPPEQVQHIANSIREFGWKQPIVIDADGVVIIGHGRLLAAKLLELKTVPCVRADDLTPKQIKALRLADNKTNESPWDFDMLDLELGDIDLDMSDFGFMETAFDESMLDELFTDAEPKEKAPKTMKCPHCGEIIEL